MQISLRVGIKSHVICTDYNLLFEISPSQRKMLRLRIAIGMDLGIGNLVE